MSGAVSHGEVDGGDDADGGGQTGATPTGGGDTSAGSDGTPGDPDGAGTAGGDTTEGSALDTGGDETGLFPGVCGDGVLNLDEDCDDGNFDNTDDCTEHCLAPACGDGFVQPSNNETCDDGNQTEGDGCNADCVESGAAVWSATFNGDDNLDDVGQAVAVDGSGAVVVAGGTEVSGEDGNILLWKVDASDASEIWSRDVVGVGHDRAYDVVVNSQDEIIATGSFYVSAQPDPGGKIWTAGFSPNGNEQWSETTASNGTGRALTLAPDDSVYATGEAMGSEPQLWLQRRDADGGELWTTQDVYGSDSSCDGNYSQYPEGVTVDPPFVHVAWRSTCPAGYASPRTKVSRFNDGDGSITYNPDGCCSHWRIDVFSPGVFNGVATRGYAMAKGPDDELVIAGQANGVGYLWGYGPDLASTETYNSAAWQNTPGGATFTDAAIDGEGNIVLASSGGRVVKATAASEFLWEHVEADVDVRGVAVDDAGYVYAVGEVAAAGQGTDVWLRKLAP
ncbi:MAG: DUF4215 domain-containing protein [Myxococcota bacterium]